MRSWSRFDSDPGSVGSSEIIRWFRFAASSESRLGVHWQPPESRSRAGESLPRSRGRRPRLTLTRRASRLAGGSSAATAATGSVPVTKHDCIRPMSPAARKQQKNEDGSCCSSQQVLFALFRVLEQNSYPSSAHLDRMRQKQQDHYCRTRCIKAGFS
jgi:hypothetical protein